MKTIIHCLAGLALLTGCASTLAPAARSADDSTRGISKEEPAGQPARPLAATSDLDLKGAAVRHLPELGVLVFEVEVDGIAGRTTPKAAGGLDGAPVLGYVFPTSLNGAEVGFGAAEGIVALAVTSHPDFDDTPLFDEDADLNFANDGGIWHPHWVLLGEDKRVPGGLSVRQFDPEDSSVQLPPTNPGMPMYMDSPGFGVTMSGDTLRVVVPLYRVSNQTQFKFDAVSAYMQVNGSDMGRPMLGVYEVYDVLSGDLSLPYSVSVGLRN